MKIAGIEFPDAYLGKHGRVASGKPIQKAGSLKIDKPKSLKEIISICKALKSDGFSPDKIDRDLLVHFVARYLGCKKSKAYNIANFLILMGYYY